MTNVSSRQLIPTVRSFNTWVESSTANWSYADAPWSEQETRNPEEDHLNVLKEKDNTISMKNEKITKLESELREVQASSTRQLKEAKSTAVKKQDSLEGDIAALSEKLHELELSHQAVSIEQDKKLSSKEDDILKFGERTKDFSIQTEQLTPMIEQGIDQGLEFLVESERRVAKLRSQELAHLNYKHTKESKATARRHERANQILQGDHEASMLKLQEYVNQHQHLRVKSESELAAARAENAEASTKIYDINLKRSRLQSDRDQALAAKSSMDNAYQQLVEKNSGLTNGLYEATKAVGDKKSSLASASNAVVSLRARLQTQKQKRKEANMKSELLLKSKDERIRRLRNEALAIKDMQNITTKMLKDELDTKDKLLEDKEAEANSSRKAQAAELQRLRSSYAKEILELEKRDRRKLQDIRDDHSKAMAQAKGDLESTQTSLDDKSLAFNSLTAKLDGLQAQHSRTIEELQKAHKEKQNFEDGNAIASKELKDQLASMARLLQDNDAELGSSSKAYATELQRLQTSNAKMTEEFESRQTTIRFSVEEGDVGSNLQSQLQHHSDYVMLLKFWLPSNLASRKAKQTDLRPKEVQGQRKFETQYCIEDPAYTEELLFAEAGSPNIRLPPKPQAQSDSRSSEEEAETRSCTEYLLFAETESPKVRLPNTAQDTPQSVPLPAEDDLDLLVPEYIPLPEDDDLNLLAPQWIPLPEDEDLELLVPELTGRRGPRVPGAGVEAIT